MNRRTVPVLVLMMAGLVSPAFGQSTPNLDTRETNQEKRISNGEASGQLTNKEAARLENGQAKLHADEAAAKADGKVTKKERAHLQHEADKQSAKVYKQKHDKQKKH